MKNDNDDARQREDDLVLRLWDEDERTAWEALAELMCLHGPSIEKAIWGRFPALNAQDVEDVVATAVRLFWNWRAKYDPAVAKVQTVLYKIAERVAKERRACRRKWEKAKKLEQEMTDVVAESLEMYDREAAEEKQEPEPPSPLLVAVSEVSRSIWSPLERDIWLAFADAQGVHVDAGELGIELGKIHNGNVPIPAGRIRVIKHRAKEKFVQELRKRGIDLKKLGYADE